ncbi:MAG: inositol monophosphatase family protein [Actinomycetota bacterium]
MNECLAVAQSLAREAGDMAMAGRRRGLSSVDTKSTLTDMVTEYDRASERLIVDGLRTQRPNDSIVGEEGAAHQGNSELTWFIDPIDGTTNFYFDLPMWAVSIGVTDTNGPLAGVVYVPALRELFSGSRGAGAHLNGRPISVRKNGQLSDALVCTGFSYSADARVRQSRRIPGMVDKVRDIRRFGAAAIDLCFVAAGRLDAYFEENLHMWDLVAGQVIATEAGAIVTDFAGNSVRPEEVMASTPAIHGDLVALLASVQAD